MYSLSSSLTKNLPNKLMWVEVVFCYISVIFLDTVYIFYVLITVIYLFMYVS